jgi:O-methyltransferase involved in polyketide biosynthesis
MDAGVCKTAADALLCKLSSSSLGVVNGTIPLSSKLIDNNVHATSVRKQTSLLNRVYFYRSSLIHKIIRKAIVVGTGHSELSRIQLLILGAGLDTTYDQYSAMCSVFLVDFPSVLLQRRSLSPQTDYSAGVTYVGHDLRYAEELIAALRTFSFDMGRPTVILLECVLCYLDSECNSNLLRVLGSNLTRSILIVYNPWLEADGRNELNFSRQLTKSFAERNAPIYRSFPSEQSLALHWMQQYSWANTKIWTLNDAVSCLLTSSERSVALASESFDEYASLSAIGNRYALMLAVSSHSASEHWLSVILRSMRGDNNVISDRLMLVLLRLNNLNRRLCKVEEQQPQERENAVVSMERCSNNQTIAHWTIRSVVALSYCKFLAL